MGGRQGKLDDCPAGPQDANHERIQNALEWSEIYHCDIRSWVSGICSRFYFDPDVSVWLRPKTSKLRQVFTQNTQPQSTQGYQFKVLPATVPGQRFSFRHTLSARRRRLKYCEQSRGKLIVKRVTAVEKYDLPIDRVPIWYVIGYRDDVAVVQFTDTLYMDYQFLVCDVRSGEVTSTFKDSYSRHPCLYEAYLSPDKSIYLLRPNLLYAVRGFADCLTKGIRVISINTDVSHVTHLIKDICESEYRLCSRIAFDPRYRSSRVAFGNYTSQRFCACIAVYDLKSQTVFQHTQDEVRGSHHIAFSPGGGVLLRVAFDSPMVYLYNPDTLEILHCIVRNVFMRNFHASITPIFSFTGQYMALVGDYGQSIAVYKLPQDHSLQNQCRVVLRRNVKEEDIPLLPLPCRLLTYLKFGPILD